MPNKTSGGVRSGSKPDLLDKLRRDLNEPKVLGDVRRYIASYRTCLGNRERDIQRCSPL